MMMTITSRLDAAKSWYDEALSTGGDKALLGFTLAQTELMFVMVDLLQNQIRETDVLTEHTPELPSSKHREIESSASPFPKLARDYDDESLTVTIPMGPSGLRNSEQLRNIADELERQRYSTIIPTLWLRAIANALDASH